MDHSLAVLVREVSRTQDGENADVQDAQNTGVQDASTDLPQCLRPNKGCDPFPNCISPKPGIIFKCKGFVGQIFKIRRSSGLVEDGWTLHPDLDTGVNESSEYILCQNTSIDKMRHVSLDDLFTLNPQFNMHGY
jgi:hypothetical protein